VEFFDVVSRRASVREYQDRAIDTAVLKKLVDAARRAPTARAVEPWEFVVISRKPALAELAKLVSPNGAFVGRAAAAIVVCARDTKYYLEDGCAATENILLAATAQGLGSCWIAGDKKTYAEAVGALIRAPAGIKLVSIIALGWPGAEAAQKKNRSAEDVVHWERF